MIEGATENTAVVQALLDNLVGRGLDSAVCRLFIIDGAKALSKAIRNTFGRHTPIQRCQVHKARNITERLAKPLHASVRKALRQAWELDDADKAERLIKNLARRLEHDAPGVAASILEGLDEILTVTRLGLPVELRRSLACTNIIENMNGTIRQVCRNVKRWRDAKMALRWTGAAMLEAAKGFRRLKAHKQLPILRAALAAHQASHSINPDLEQKEAAEPAQPAMPAERISTVGGTFPWRDGPLPIRRIARDDWPPVCAAADRALARMGHGYIDDLNAAPRDGYARVTLNNLPDRRVSAAAAYLTPDVRARANLRIEARTRAVRVLFAERRAIGVATDGPGGGGAIHGRNVILAAGALQTPTLLLRSGVGPAAALTALGIPVIADNRGVGTGLQEHPTAGVGLIVRPGFRQDPALRPNGNLVLRLSSSSLSPDHAGAPAHDIFMPVYNKTTWHALGQRLGLVQAVLCGPNSRGTVTLRSPDPNVAPEVRFNLLDDPRDMARMKTAYRFAVTLAEAPELAGLIHGTFPASLTERVRRLNLATRRNGALAAVASKLVDLSGITRRAVLRHGLGTARDTAALARDDAALEAWLTENARGFFHASCSCPMGAEGDPMAALDSRCHVRGVDGLRVVDASVMPRITRASTNIQTMMIGERAADLIAADN